MNIIEFESFNWIINEYEPMISSRVWFKASKSGIEQDFILKISAKISVSLSKWEAMLYFCFKLWELLITPLWIILNLSFIIGWLFLLKMGVPSVTSLQWPRKEEYSMSFLNRSWYFFSLINCTNFLFLLYLN